MLEKKSLYSINILGRPKKRNIKQNKRRKNDDDDWEPMSDIFFHQNGIKVENNEHDLGSSKPNFKLNVQEKNVYKEYMNLAKKYGHIIRVHPPESHGPDLQDLQNYKLSEELDNYVQTSMSSTKQKKNLYR